MKNNGYATRTLQACARQFSTLPYGEGLETGQYQIPRQSYTRLDSFPQFYEYNLSQLGVTYPSIKLLLTGVSIGAFDALALTPFERWKVVLMTRKSNNSMFSNYSGKPFLKELFRGSTPIFIQSSYAWGVFLLADYELRSYATKYSTDAKVPLHWVLSASAFMGFMNSCLMQPVQVVKTKFQKENPLENRGILKTMKNIIQSQGIKALYVGWRMNVVRSIFFATFDFLLIKNLNP